MIKIFILLLFYFSFFFNCLANEQNLQDLQDADSRIINTETSYLRDAYKAKTNKDYRKCVKDIEKYFASSERQKSEDFKIKYDTLECFKKTKPQKYIEMSIDILQGLNDKTLNTPKYGTEQFYILVKDVMDQVEVMQAKTSLNQLSEMFIKDDKFIAFCAKAFLKFGDYTKAIQQLKSCLLVNISNPICQKNIAIAFDANGQIVKAVEFYKNFYNDNCLTNKIRSINESDETKELQTAECKEVKKRMDFLMN
jgi:tetratricopeptide (TPR) repeat protein